MLNPKLAILYLSLLPQFVSPKSGGVLPQVLTLGVLQIMVSLTVNTAFILTAGSVAAFLASRPKWALVQRWLTGTLLAGLAVRIAAEARR